jgi:YD repeat-containing protein
MLLTSPYDPRCGSGVAVIDGLISLIPVQYFLSTAKVPCSCTGDPQADPINPATGNVYTTEADVKVAGASAIEYQRFYNSSDLTGNDGVSGWRHSYSRSVQTIYQSVAASYPGQSSSVSPLYNAPQDACISGFAAVQGSVSAWAGATVTYNGSACVVSNGATVLTTLPIQVYPAPIPPPVPIEYDVVRDSGEVLRFPILAAGVSNQPGVSFHLATTASGFTVTDDQDNVENYNTEGVLQSIVSRAGVVQTLSYDSSGLWSGVTDSFGNALSATRNANGTIASVAVSGGGTVQYGYDFEQRLTTVTNMDGTVRGYTYVLSYLNALSTLVDESGVTLSSWTYDSLERGTSSTEAGGANAMTLAYNSDGSVTSTDALGAVRTFTFTRVGDVDQVTSISGSQCPTCQDSAATTYDSSGWIASRTDYNGNLTCYANDPTRGLELVRVEGFAPGSTCPSNLASYTPVAGTTQRKISTTWSSDVCSTYPDYGSHQDNLARLRRLRQRADQDDHRYDRHPNVSRTWTYTYNSFGRY